MTKRLLLSYYKALLLHQCTYESHMSRIVVVALFYMLKPTEALITIIHHSSSR
jgi:hypothetical protein